MPFIGNYHEPLFCKLKQLRHLFKHFYLLSANLTKLSNTIKQFAICRNLPGNCLSVFDHFVVLALKGFNCVSKVKAHCLSSCRWIKLLAPALFVFIVYQSLFNPLQPDVAFLYPLKTEKQHRVVVG